MIPFFSLRNARECLLGALAIYTLSVLELGFHSFHFTNDCAAPLWPSSGLALALLLLRGWRLFPAISLGTIAATSTFGFDLPFRIAGSFGNTVESLAGWYLMTRVFDFSPRMERVRDALILILVGATIGPLLNSIICNLGMMLTAHPLNTSRLGEWLLLFWTGNMLGILVFNPVFLHLSLHRPRVVPPDSGSMTWILILIGVVFLGFFSKSSGDAGLYPLAYLSFPILVWRAISKRHDVTLSIALVTSMATIFTALGRGPFNTPDVSVTFAELTIYILVYCITCLIIMTSESERSLSAARAMDLGVKSARREVEIRTMRSSMNSHFLFNALNVIKSLVGKEPEKAREALVSLSDLLRSTLRMTRCELIPLSDELKAIRSYLDLQMIRYGGHLSLSLTVDPGTEHLTVPPMLFHQIVENAFKHGVDAVDGTCRLEIHAERKDGQLNLSVLNTGRLGRTASEGLGLRSIREQLEALYGAAAFFTITQETDDLVFAVIGIPLPPSETPEC
jgi:integral membrane sensor domain MASE1